MWKKIGIIPIIPPFSIDGKCPWEACNHIALNKTTILPEMRTLDWTILLILRAVNTFHHSEIQIPNTLHRFPFEFYFFIISTKYFLLVPRVIYLEMLKSQTLKVIQNHISALPVGDYSAERFGYILCFKLVFILNVESFSSLFLSCATIFSFR